ncbi:MAG: hypothetical protein M3150_09885, partial [Pseudomonadota bacterium]|nr:hypothetical protein [Pseudomonadota bacterium]
EHADGDHEVGGQRRAAELDRTFAKCVEKDADQRAVVPSSTVSRHDEIVRNIDAFSQKPTYHQLPVSS